MLWFIYFSHCWTRFLWAGEFNRGRFWPLTRTMASDVSAGKNKFNGIFSEALVNVNAFNQRVMIVHVIRLLFIHSTAAVPIIQYYLKRGVQYIYSCVICNSIHNPRNMILWPFSAIMLSVIQVAGDLFHPYALRKTSTRNRHGIHYISYTKRESYITTIDNDTIPEYVNNFLRTIYTHTINTLYGVHIW